MINNKKIIEALNAKSDFSENFTIKIKNLCEKIESCYGINPIHDSDMNYSSGQKILFLFNDIFEVCSSYSIASYQIEFFISSKGKFFTYIYFKKNKENQWIKSNNINIFNNLENFLKNIIVILNSEEYEYLEYENIQETVDGKFTQIDGAPATIFEVLFSELI